MSGDNFYLTLPSNAGETSNASTFRIALPQTIKLTGEWEVALVELIYPYSWYNVDEPKPIASLETTDEAITLFMAKLKSGYYNRIEDLLEAISESLPMQYRENVICEYDAKSNRVEIKLQDPVVALHLPTFLMYILGYNINPYDQNKQSDAISYSPGIRRDAGPAPHPPDMRAGLGIFYVYCDVVEQNVVGNKLAPLLRAIAVQGEFGDIIDNIFVHPHYMPVLKKEFDSVEIAIKTDQNTPLALQYGKTMVKLHFRRKRLSLFE